MDPKSPRIWLPTVLVAILLTSWIVWLRAPTFATPLWNVDEAVSAVAARSILDGGVMYRDIADHRTPFSYYAVAALFKITGVSVPALHVLLAGAISLTALGVYWLGRDTRGRAAGACGALIFAALACYLMLPSDAYAAHTEWFLITFTTWAAVLFFRGNGSPGFGRSIAIGVLYAGAFLSKQPGLVDFAAPVGTLLYLGVMRERPWSSVARSLAGMLLGFSAVTGVVAVIFVALGAWSDVAFYTWIYNTRYYGPETSLADRVLAPLPFLLKLGRVYPLVFVSGILGAIAVAFRVAQWKPSAGVARTRSWEIFVLLWCGTSLAGAMAGGRSFDHYFIQCLPPFAWMAAWLPGAIIAHWRSFSRAGLRALAAIFLLGLLVSVGWTPLKARRVEQPPPDPALRLATFIRNHSNPRDRIFVWGYNPDIYLYADRSAASRFLYCTFHTGLIPWTNLDPARDTTYAIVPGAMDALLRDLARTRPAFIVDCGVGPHRRFSKYPLSKFSLLRAYVEKHYVEVDPERYQAQGFRLFMLSDPLKAPAVDAPGITVGGPSAPHVHGPEVVGDGPVKILVDVEAKAPPLRGLALYLDGRPIAATQFPASESMIIESTVSLDAAQPLQHRLQAIATLDDGHRVQSELHDFRVVKIDTTSQARSTLALPTITSYVTADGVRSLNEPRTDVDTGERVFTIHAPSLITYTVPANTKVLRGRFGIFPGAYAPENRAPTDGATFIVRAFDAAGKPHVLLEQFLDPVRNSANRPAQPFRVELTPALGAVRLELEITPGPSGSAASDWTYWSDLVLEISP